MHTLSNRIAEVISTTAPGKARTKALKAIRWVMECSEGFAALPIGGCGCVLVQNVEEASVFTGCDDEKTKLAFWSIQLGKQLTIAILS